MPNHFDEETIETTLSRLLAVIDEVTETDDESFAVLAMILDEGRVSFITDPMPYAN